MQNIIRNFVKNSQSFNLYAEKLSFETYNIVLLL